MQGRIYLGGGIKVNYLLLSLETFYRIFLSKIYVVSVKRVFVFHVFVKGKKLEDKEISEIDIWCLGIDRNGHRV